MPEITDAELEPHAKWEPTENLQETETGDDKCQVH